MGTTLTGPAVVRGWGAVTAPGRAPERLVTASVELIAGAVLSLVLVWLLVCAVVCLTDRSRASAPPSAGPFRPRFMRALVAVAIGSAMVSTTAGAHAERGPELPARLDGLTLPDRVYGVVRTHEVRAGESLWSVTADLVVDRPRPGTRSGAPPDLVARACAHLYRLNHRRIGPDPDLIRPGTTLRLPPRPAAMHRGAPR